MQQKIVDAGPDCAEPDLVAGRIGQTGEQHLLDDFDVVVVLVAEDGGNGTE